MSKNNIFVNLKLLFSVRSDVTALLDPAVQVVGLPHQNWGPEEGRPRAHTEISGSRAHFTQHQGYIFFKIHPPPPFNQTWETKVEQEEGKREEKLTLEKLWGKIGKRARNKRASRIFIFIKL